MDSKRAKNNIRNWQRCDIAQLVNHFHKMENLSEGIQQTRLESMVLHGSGLAELKAGPVHSLTLHMALKEEQSVNGEIGFEPVLEMSKGAGPSDFVNFSNASDDQAYAGLVAYWTMQNWLDGFAYHIEINALTFVVTLAFISVGYRTYKAAVSNPVDSLKVE
jgi:hypothetical protein